MATQTATKWKKVSSNFVKLEKEGESIEGILTKKSPLYFQGQELPTGRYTFNCPGEKGEVISKTILGTVGLDEQMADIDVGTKVRVTFDGVRHEKGKRDFKLFTVEIAE